MGVTTLPLIWVIIGHQADGRATAAYLQFTNVLVFEVTYKTNKLKMPFSPFTGVNHHFQSSLFGGALLEDKNAETFVWLFLQFRGCMFDRPPAAIITDQDTTIYKAVVIVFPESCHRYYMWHVRKHEVEHLQGYRAWYPNFEHEYERWVRSETPAEFEGRWDQICQDFNVGPRCWLRTMYEKRQHWVKFYLNHVFQAEMTTTERSESMNAYFDCYVNSNTMLNEFVVQYDKTITACRAAEEREDF